jgi:hypothetical protein
MKNIGMKEADFRNYIDNNFVNAIRKGNRPARKRNYPFNASGDLPYGPGSKLRFPNGAIYIVDYENNLRYYGWNYKDVSSAIPVTYADLIKYSPVNSEGWFGRKITDEDPLLITPPVTELQTLAADEASADTNTSLTKTVSKGFTANKNYIIIGIMVLGAGFLLWKYKNKILKK